MKKSGQNTNCLTCNKEFYTKPSDIGKVKFCCRKCRTNYRSPDTWTKVTCAKCNKEFLKENNRLTSKTGLYFCTRECKDLAQRYSSIPEMYKHYGEKRTGLGIREVIDRFGFKQECVGCQENRLYLLCIHHIDSDRTNNEISNFEIVCYNCHALRHMELKNNIWNVNFKKLTPRNLLDDL